MAIFHLDFKIVKRSEGMTSVAKAAYHARTRITDDRIGQVFDFSHRTDLHGHIILAPVSAPSHIIESSLALWNEVERVERQNNGQTARYEEIVIPDYPATAKQQPVMATSEPYRRPAVKSYRDPNKISKVSAAGKKSPVLVAPAPNKSTKLKTPSLQNTRAINRAPMSNRKQVKPRQNGMFKRFTLLVVSFFKEKFIWANKRKPDTTDADHDKRVAANYVFDEVLGICVPRTEFEKRAKFNNDPVLPEAGVYGNESDNDKTVRFPSRFNEEQYRNDKKIGIKIVYAMQQKHTLGKRI
ncbi:MobA/MobL family protein [Salmonella enterica]|nr:MobA/MobL family protein [Salmonella enterica]